jgi:YesN/AraC family two-component response regulator
MTEVISALTIIPSKGGNSMRRPGSEEERTYRILIVDDDKDCLSSLKNILLREENMVLEIFTANNGEEAWNRLQEKGFDLVLSDYKMPGMDGIELLARVKDKFPNTQRILITAFSDLSVAKQAINKAEIHNYIEKPWDNEELKKTIFLALKRKGERLVVVTRTNDSSLHDSQNDIL